MAVTPSSHDQGSLGTRLVFSLLSSSHWGSNPQCSELDTSYPPASVYPYLACWHTIQHTRYGPFMWPHPVVPLSVPSILVTSQDTTTSCPSLHHMALADPPISLVCLERALDGLSQCHCQDPRVSINCHTITPPGLAIPFPDHSVPSPYQV